MDEEGGEVHAHDPAGVCEGPDHLVGHVPGMVADGPGVGVGGDDGPLCHVYEVPEPGVAEVGGVYQDAEAVQLLDGLHPELREPTAGPRVRHAIGQGVPEAVD